MRPKRCHLAANPLDVTSYVAHTAGGVVVATPTAGPSSRAEWTYWVSRPGEPRQRLYSTQVHPMSTTGLRWERGEP